MTATRSIDSQHLTNDDRYSGYLSDKYYVRQIVNAIIYQFELYAMWYDRDGGLLWNDNGGERRFVVQAIIRLFEYVGQITFMDPSYPKRPFTGKVEGSTT